MTTAPLTAGAIAATAAGTDGQLVPRPFRVVRIRQAPDRARLRSVTPRHIAQLNQKNGAFLNSPTPNGRECPPTWRGQART